MLYIRKALAFAAIIPAIAQASGLIDVVVDEKSPEAIFARENAHNPELSALAYRATLHEAYKNEAEKRGYNDFQKSTFLTREDTRTLDITKGTSWRNGYIEAMGKDAIAAAQLLAHKKGIPLPTNILTKGYTDYLDSKATPANRNLMDSENSVRVASSVLRAYQDPSDPNHADAVKLVGPHFPDLVPGKSLEYQPSVKNERRSDGYIYQFNKLLLQGKDTKQFIAKYGSQMKNEILAEERKTLEEVNKMHEEAKRDRSDRMSEQVVRERQEKFNDAAGTLGSLAEAGRWLNLPSDGAYRLNQGAKFVSLLGEADKLTGAFSSNPLKYTNIYLALTVTMGNMLMGGGDSGAATMEAIKQLAVQIENLRKEMHERFDALDHKLNRYFEKTLINLNNIQATVVQSQLLLIKSLEESQKLDRKITQGIWFLEDGYLTDKNSKCFGYGTNKVPFKLQEDDAVNCRNAYARLATSLWNLPQQTLGANAPLQQILGESYNSLREELSSKNLAPPAISTGDAGMWMLGTKLFLNFFRLHPEFLSFATEPHVDLDNEKDDEKTDDTNRLRLSHLIELGKSYAESLRNFVLQPVTDKTYKLNKEVFEHLFSTYSADVTNAFKLADNALNIASGSGARVNISPEEQSPDMTDHLQAFTQPLHYCAALEKNPNPVGATVAISPNLPTELILRSVPEWTHLDGVVSTILPRTLLNMAHDNFNGVTLKTCVRTLDLSKALSRGIPMMGGDYRLSITIVFDVVHLRLDPKDGHPIVTPLARFQFHVDRDGLNSISSPNPNSICPWYWGDAQWSGYFEKNVYKNYFQLSNDPSVEANLAAIAKNYQEGQESKLNTGKEGLTNLIDQKSNHAREKIQLALLLGLEPNMETQESIKQLVSGNLLPKPSDVADLYYKGVPKQQLLSEIDDRLITAQKIIDDLAQSETLKPRSREIEKLVTKLESLQNGQIPGVQSGGVRGFACSHFGWICPKEAAEPL
jgi:hypothetical protein